jgi:hypothetical protein
MEFHSDDNDAAELYYRTLGIGSRKAVSYRRFASMTDAVSFVMNEISPRDRSSCFLEFDGRRLDYEGISKLYWDDKHPAPHRLGEPI